MEKKMTRSLGLSAALVCIALLLGSGSFSARAGGALVQTQARLATQSEAATLAVPAQVLTIWTNAIYTNDNDGVWGKDKDKDKDKDGDGDGDGDKDDHHHRYHHDPTPEPSTLLSFGAAILIGGGVLYSRRLRGNKK
jgi:hypothetical protein